ncbi:MAG: hypothetical protein M3Y20_03925 [Actinomycetota bacterium]|nr:hypothetical protein [Actinomycetota bacterium]
MSRISVVAASAAFLLLIAAGPAQAAEIERVAPEGPGIGVVLPGGGAQTQAIWTWVCQLLGGCK